MIWLVLALSLADQAGPRSQLPASDGIRPGTTGTETAVRDGEADPKNVALGQKVLGRRNTRLSTRITRDKLRSVIDAQTAGVDGDFHRYGGDPATDPSLGAGSMPLGGSVDPAGGEQPTKRR